MGHGDRIIISPHTSLTKNLYHYNFATEFFLIEENMLYLELPEFVESILYPNCLSRNICSCIIYIKTSIFFNTVSEMREGSSGVTTTNWIFHCIFWVIFSEAKPDALHVEEMLVWYATGYKPTSKKKKNRNKMVQRKQQRKSSNGRIILSVNFSFCLMNFIFWITF